MRGVLAAVVLVAACRAGDRGASESSPVATPRFPHAAEPHARLACVVCHPVEDVVAGRPARPGADDHAPCDRGECHAEEFLRASASFCALCHDRVVPWEVGATTPAAYPPAAGARALASEFSHKTHLDKGAMDRASGFHVSCGDCHERVEAAADPGLPAHVACARCHDAARERPARPTMDRCTDCHRGKLADPPRARRLIKGDLKFRHAAHEVDRAGRTIPCVTCHPRIAEKSRTGKDAPPATSVCVECHDDATRTPLQASMARCATCHQRQVGGLESFVAPRSHLPPRDRPDDHTLAFRKDHAADAQRDAARCARCHSAMSGSGRDNCSECHYSMRPTDHVVSWGELDHGPEAATDRDRCATCHGGEFCVTCHSVRPRSHFPTWVWREREHGEQALDRPRSCATCHTCNTCAGCHLGVACER